MKLSEDDVKVKSVSIHEEVMLNLLQKVISTEFDTFGWMIGWNLKRDVPKCFYSNLTSHQHSEC